MSWESTPEKDKRKEFEDLVVKNMHLQIDNLIDYTINARVTHEIELRKNLEAKILDFRNRLEGTEAKTLIEWYDKHFGIVTKK